MSIKTFVDRPITSVMQAVTIVILGYYQPYQFAP